MRKLFKGGKYLREETIWGNTAYKVSIHCMFYLNDAILHSLSRKSRKCVKTFNAFESKRVSRAKDILYNFWQKWMLLQNKFWPISIISSYFDKVIEIVFLQGVTECYLLKGNRDKDRNMYLWFPQEVAWLQLVDSK